MLLQLSRSEYSDTSQLWCYCTLHTKVHVWAALNLQNLTLWWTSWQISLFNGQFYRQTEWKWDLPYHLWLSTTWRTLKMISTRSPQAPLLVSMCWRHCLWSGPMEWKNWMTSLTTSTASITPNSSWRSGYRATCRLRIMMCTQEQTPP